MISLFETVVAVSIILFVMCIVIFDKRIVISRGWNTSNLAISAGLVSLFDILSLDTISFIVFAIIFVIFGGIGVVEIDVKSLAPKLPEDSSLNLLADPLDMEK